MIKFGLLGSSPKGGMLVSNRYGKEPKKIFLKVINKPSHSTKKQTLANATEKSIDDKLTKFTKFVWEIRPKNN